MRTKQTLIVYFLSLALLLGMVPTSGVSAAKKASLSKKITIIKGKSKTIKVKNTKTKVKWKIRKRAKKQQPLMQRKKAGQKYRRRQAV